MDILRLIVAIVVMVARLLSTPHPAPAPATPKPVVRTAPAPRPAPPATRRPPSRATVTGLATWYAWRPGQAAAGPALRRALGSHWRGKTVTVCASGRCVRATLTDWCACSATRVIDLDQRLFARLAAPWRGVIEVTVTR